ncbi:diaminopimelate epimerase [Duganella sp. FT80W]|uniref:Diaminopimelate epimerase n=1 Tax=Duganella guangzhouensis TaxID=2666084 RepID=A0A6I2KZG3_9BURK|nr:diaminopimelate epimerase [Duganella guangzhouensis]
MQQDYDARGNIYTVISPQQLQDLGISIPMQAASAAQQRRSWSSQAVELLCSWPDGVVPAGAKPHRTDGLLIGPFQSVAPFDVLIVNTDGSLAERSGNGLTIFAQSLVDRAIAPPGAYLLQVHHDSRALPSPLPTPVTAGAHEGQSGWWLTLGEPSFGPKAVAADLSHIVENAFNGKATSRVPRLARLHPSWGNSQFVRIGNPHCVTLLRDHNDLPSFAALHENSLLEPLTLAAFPAPPGLGAGDPCPAGVNLQWVALAGEQHLLARVFERGEGPTASSGTSASAVASAAWRVGLVQAGIVRVEMPGGTAPIQLTESDSGLQVALFGTAARTV